MCYSNYKLKRKKEIKMATILWIIMVWFVGPILLGAFRCFKAGLVGEAIYRLVAAAGVVLILYTMIVVVSI